MQEAVQLQTDLLFSGNVYIFHAFDIGDDINLDKVAQLQTIVPISSRVPKYFKNYHMPLAIELPDQQTDSFCMSSKIHNFGALSLLYKIPFHSSLKELRKNFNAIEDSFAQQSITDAQSIFTRVEKSIGQPHFFQTRSSYIVIQIDPKPEIINVSELQENYGDLIASMLRFEVESLSEHQIKEILSSAIGYFRGDLIIVDTDVSFVYDDEYEEILDLFEFANIQSLELRYFDRLLDMKLNDIYEGHVKPFPFRAYLPVIGSLIDDPVEKLGKIRADISVITERLDSSIKLAGEPYFSELYDLLVDNLDIKSWRDGIDRKLRIVESVQTGYQRKIETNREDMLSLLITILIFIELIIGILSYIK
jgi:hypothetical protein